MVKTKSNTRKNILAVSNSLAKHYADIAENYANQAEQTSEIIQNTADEIAEMLKAENLTTIKNNIQAINTMVDNIEDINTIVDNLPEILNSNFEWGVISGDIDSQTDLIPKLEAQKAYTTGNVLTDSMGYQEVLEASKSTFDLSRFTVVGSPVITDDGVVSGFSNSSYIKIPNLTLGDNFEIDGSFTAPSTFSNIEYYFSSFTSPVISLGIGGAASNKTIINYGNGTSWIASNVLGQTIIQPNTKYYYKIIYNGTTLSVLLSQNAVTYNTEYSTTVSLNLGEYGYVIGTNRNLGNVFTGSISLPSTKITADGQEIFSGAKTGLDIIKSDNYTVVGSPTVTDDGVLVGYIDNNNCVKSPLIDTTNAETMNIEMEFAITKAPNDAGQTFIYAFDNTSEPATAPKCVIYHNFISVSTGSLSNTSLNIGDVFRYEGYFSGNDGKSCSEKVYKNNELVFEGSTTTLSYNWKKTSNFWFGSGHGAITELSYPLSSIKVSINDNLIYQPCLKIPYTLSKTGSKIVDVSARGRVQDVYEQYGEALYYTLDEENQNYTIPMGEVYGMINRSDTTPTYNLQTAVTITANTDYSITQKGAVNAQLTSGTFTINGLELISGAGNGLFPVNVGDVVKGTAGTFKFLPKGV